MSLRVPKEYEAEEAYPAVLSTLVRDETDHNQGNNRDTCKDGETDGEYGELLARNLERSRGRRLSRIRSGGA